MERFTVKKIALGGLGVALLAGFLLLATRSGPLAPIRVTTAAVQTASLTPSLFGVGTVEARRSYLIGPTVPGRVLNIQVDVGEAVKAGQLLAEMEPVDLEQKLNAQQAALARAHSAVSAAVAQRADARARWEIAAIEHRRYVELDRQHFVSTSAVDGKRQQMLSAQAALDASSANLQAAQQELTRLEAERQGIAEQRRQLRLVAPRDGLVSSRDAEPGSTVVAGQAVVKLIEPSSLWVKVRLDQGRSHGVHNGMRASVALRSNPRAPLAGKVVRIDPISDSVTEERVVFVSLDVPPAGLTVGELAEVTLEAPAAAPSLVIPNAAVKHTAEGSGVWLLRDDSPTFTPVTLGERSLDGRVQILSGLTASDKLVVYSEKSLRAGARIKVVERLVQGDAP